MINLEKENVRTRVAVPQNPLRHLFPVAGSNGHDEDAVHLTQFLRVAGRAFYPGHDYDPPVVTSQPQDVLHELQRVVEPLDLTCEAVAIDSFQDGHDYFTQTSGSFLLLGLTSTVENKQEVPHIGIVRSWKPKEIEYYDTAQNKNVFASEEELQAVWRIQDSPHPTFLLSRK